MTSYSHVYRSIDIVLTSASRWETSMDRFLGDPPVADMQSTLKDLDLLSCTLA